MKASRRAHCPLPTSEGDRETQRDWRGSQAALVASLVMRENEMSDRVRVRNKMNILPKTMSFHLFIKLCRFDFNFLSIYITSSVQFN